MNFTVTHGDTWQFYGDVEMAWPLGCTTCSQIPFDLTDYTATGLLTRTLDSCQAIELQVTVEDAPLGKLHVYLDAAKSAALDKGVYQYEVVITGPNLVFTAFKGTVTFV